jgi:hypothetical protein
MSQPFFKGGYGWSWFRWQNAQSNGVPFPEPSSKWFNPGLWPSVWHYGVGIEWVPWRRVGVEAGGLEIAMRLEYARYQQTLGLDFLDEVRIEDLPAFGRRARPDRRRCAWLRTPRCARGAARDAGARGPELEALFRAEDWSRIFEDDRPRRDLPMRRKRLDRQQPMGIELGAGMDGLRLPPELVGGGVIQVGAAR